MAVGHAGQVAARSRHWCTVIGTLCTLGTHWTLGSSGCRRGLGSLAHDGHGLGGIVRVKAQGDGRIGIFGITRGLDDEGDLSTRGFERFAESDGDASEYGPRGRMLHPSAEAQRIRADRRFSCEDRLLWVTKVGRNPRLSLGILVFSVDAHTCTVSVSPSPDCSTLRTAIGSERA